MALNIEDPVTEQLAHELARVTRTSIIEAVTVALRERLAAARSREVRRGLLTRVAEIQAFVRAQPDRNARATDEILGYDRQGLPG